MKVIVDNKIPYIRKAIQEIADEAVFLNGSDICASDVADADALIIRTRTKCNQALLENSKVKYIATATIGFDHLDLEYIKKRNIVWKNCPGCNASSVGQYIHSCLLLLAQKGSISLKNSTMGIIGAGHVGQAVAKAASELGIRILFNDPPLEEETNEKTAFVSLEEIKKECNIISFHTPLTKTGKYPTFHLADKTFMEGLRKDCILINTSRGEVVDNAALLDCLENHQIADAIIDTWENEPDINLKLLDKVFIGTPHIAGYSADGKANATRMALTGICQYFGRSYTTPIEAPELPAEKRPDPNAPKEIQDLQLYNPQRDSDMLKKHPEQFEELRGNYPLRREK